MAFTSTYNTFDEVDLPTSDTTIYTAPAGAPKVANIASCYFSNKAATLVTITVKIVRKTGSPSMVLIKDAPIPAGGAIDIVLNKPILLKDEDYLVASTNTASTVDVVGSVLELTTV